MEALVSSILKYYELIKGLLYVVLAIIIPLYFYIKSGSSYSMLSRVWSLLIGKKKFSNHEMSKLMNEREDIDKFNFVFNVKANSVEQILRLQKRIKTQKIDIKLISNSKGHFYINTCKLKVPKMKYLISTSIMALLLMFMVPLVLQVAIMPAAILKFNDTNTWFWFNHEYAKRYTLPIPIVDLLFDNWKIDSNTCNDTGYPRERLSKITKLTVPEIDIICNTFKKENHSKKLDEIIKGQKVFYFLSLFPLFLSLYAFRASLYMLLSYDLRNFLLKKKKIIKRNNCTKYFGS